MLSVPLQLLFLHHQVASTAAQAQQRCKAFAGPLKQTKEAQEAKLPEMHQNLASKRQGLSPVLLDQQRDAVLDLAPALSAA
jgi:hypothetical protein